MNETYQQPGKWIDIQFVPILQRTNGHQYIISRIIKELHQNSAYEAIVQAKNFNGWNDVSLIYFIYQNII